MHMKRLTHRSKHHPYSMTSSARAISVGGTVTPIAFCALSWRLITRLNLVWLLDGNIRRLFASQNLDHGNVAAPVQRWRVRTKGHQAADLGKGSE